MLLQQVMGIYSLTNRAYCPKHILRQELAFAISHEIIHYTKKHGYSLKDNFDDISDFLTLSFTFKGSGSLNVIGKGILIIT